MPKLDLAADHDAGTSGSRVLGYIYTFRSSRISRDNRLSLLSGLPGPGQSILVPRSLQNPGNDRPTLIDTDIPPCLPAHSPTDTLLRRDEPIRLWGDHARVAAHAAHDAVPADDASAGCNDPTGFDHVHDDGRRRWPGRVSPIQVRAPLSRSLVSAMLIVFISLPGPSRRGVFSCLLLSHSDLCVRDAHEMTSCSCAAAATKRLMAS